MGIRYSQLPKVTAPPVSSMIAVLDTYSAVLETMTISNLSDLMLGTANISGIGGGTVKGAIKYLYDYRLTVTQMTQSQYDALSTAQKNDGNIRYIP